MTRILFSLAILAVTLCATAQANTNEEMNIPIEVTSTGHLVVDLTLHDGEPVSAIFDTGATFAMVGGRTAARISQPQPTTTTSGTVNLIMSNTSR